MACDPHDDLSRERSCEVKNARDVLRLPDVHVISFELNQSCRTYYETLC